MLSFYDWYADLPVASPQVFGDQTDVPGVRRLVGRLLPDHVGLQPAGHPHPGRALDDRGALPRPEGRRGQPRLLRRTPSSPTSGWPPRPGTDGALAMAMGHVDPHASSSSTGRCRTSPTTSSASPTCRSWSRCDRARRRLRARTSSSPPPTSATTRARTRRSRRCCSTPRPASPTVPERLARLPLRRRGRGQVEPRPGRASTRC